MNYRFGYGLEEKKAQRVLVCARNKDIKKLKQLLKDLKCTDLFQREKNPIIILAVECDHETVNFLQVNFNANINPIIFGYAMANEDEKVNELLKAYANPNYAILGYAYKNNHDKVEFMLGKGGNNDAVEGKGLARIGSTLSDYYLDAHAKEGYMNLVNHYLDNTYKYNIKSYPKLLSVFFTHEIKLAFIFKLRKINFTSG